VPAGPYTSSLIGKSSNQVANKMLYCCQWFLTLLLIYYVVPAQVSAQQDETKPVKYAPNYCLRFRFNCNRPEKKSHVCCLYPQNPNPSGGEEKRPSPNYGTAVKFRPVKLPKVKPKKTEEDTNEQEEKNDDGRKKPSASLSNLKKGRPEFKPKQNPGKTGVKKQQSLRPLKIKSKSTPRICKRLVVNCKKSPEHRCCQYLDVNPVTDEVKPEVEVPEVPEDDPTPPPSPPPKIPSKPETSNSVAIEAPKEVVKGEVEVVDLEIPVVVEAQNKFAKIINDEVTVGVPKNEPYQRIPAECFTESFDCDQDPDNKCCAILEK